jgi:hypothetical protein
MKTRTTRVARIWIAVMAMGSCVAVAGTTNGVTRTYRFEDTVPVKGMVVIRAVRVEGERRFKPVQFDREKQSWVVVAESFEAYKNSLEAKSRELSETEKKAARTNELKALESVQQLPLSQQIGFIAQRLTAEQRAQFQSELNRQQADRRRGEVCPPSG